MSRKPATLTGAMAFRYTPKLEDGSDAGEVALGLSPNPGEESRVRR